MTLAFLKSSGKVDVLIHELYNKDNGCIKTLVDALITLGFISSGPLALLIFSFNISSWTSDSKIGAKKNELLILFFRYCLKLVFWLPIFVSKLQPTLLKKIIKIIRYHTALSYLFPIHLQSRYIAPAFLITVKYWSKVLPQVFCWITSITQNFFHNKILLNIWYKFSNFYNILYICWS